MSFEAPSKNALVRSLTPQAERGQLCAHDAPQCSPRASAQHKGSRCPHGLNREGGREGPRPRTQAPLAPPPPRTNTEETDGHLSSLSFSLVKPWVQDFTEETPRGPTCPCPRSPEAPSCSREAARWPEGHGRGKAQGRQPPPVSKDRKERTDRCAPSERHMVALRRPRGQSPGRMVGGAGGAGRTPTPRPSLSHQTSSGRG